MKANGLIIGAIVLVVILVGVFIYFQKPNKINSGAEDSKDWMINMNYSVANSGVSTIVALPIECYKNGIRNNGKNNSNIDKNYISNYADYIVNVKIDNITISGDKRTFIFEIVNFEKGELDYIPQTLQISNPYNPGIEDDSPFQKFKENKHYRVYIKNTDNQPEFVCGMEGIEELSLY